MIEIESNIDALRNIKKEAVLRPNLGDASLMTWEEKYQVLLQKLSLIYEYYIGVTVTINTQVLTQIKEIRTLFEALMRFDESTFINNKKGHIASINNCYNKILEFIPHY